jgi:transcriptional regulator with AAA-type ATPase domain
VQAAVLLGRHVARRTGDRRGLAAGQRGLRRHRADQAEVGDARAAVAADQHVVRLEVAVDQASVVRGGQAAAGLDEAVADLAPAARRGGEPRTQRAAIDQLHRQVDPAVGHAGLVHRDDVGMRQPRHRLRLADQLGIAGRRSTRAQHLERELAIEHRIVGGDHPAGAALAERAQDHEPAHAGRVGLRPRRDRLGRVLPRFRSHHHRQLPRYIIVVVSDRRRDRGGTEQAEPTLPLAVDRAALALLVLGPGVELEVALRGRSTWTLGRARDNDVVIDHPSVSRHHGRLHAGDGFALEALPVTNPLRFGGRSLSPGERVPIAPGEAFAIGSLVGVIRPVTPSRPAVDPELPPGTIVADPAMRRLYDVIARIAPSDVPVLILGETGVGKELIAHAIHLGSPRAAEPFLRINCGALPGALVESELFGHARGAFTGADRSSPGLLASATGGTVLLDEVGELPLPLQVTLLRVLEDGVVWPLGAVRPASIDVRWVAATNRDLAAEVERGRFRKDLYYRLQGFVVAVPPLRERRSEIAAIAGALASRAAGGPRVLTEALLAALERHAWPGNVRELRNALASAVLLAGAGPIDVEHLPATITGGPPGVAPTSAAAPARALRDALADEERRRIVEALRHSGGNQSRAAELLGMPRRTLVKRLAEYGIPRGRVIPDGA